MANHWRYESYCRSNRAVRRLVGWIHTDYRSSIWLGWVASKSLVQRRGRNPTASFKDHLPARSASPAFKLAENDCLCFDGNAASSWQVTQRCRAALKRFCAADSAEPVAQLRVPGRPCCGEASYDAAYDLCSEACQEFGWYRRNCVSPVLVEGKKTAGLEVAEQSHSESLTDWIAVSVGDGCYPASGKVEQMHELG
jgi:threonine synthase